MGRHYFTEHVVLNSVSQDIDYNIKGTSQYLFIAYRITTGKIRTDNVEEYIVR